MCIFSGNFDFIIFSGISALLILQFWSHIDYNKEQFVSAFPLKHFSGNFGTFDIRILFAVKDKCLDVHFWELCRI